MKQSDQIEQLIGEYRSILLAKKHLTKLQRRIASTEHDLKLLERIKLKEYKEVRALETLSVTSLFQTILGNKKEQYEIEKQEYLHAVLKYKEYAKTLELMIYEKEVLEEKVAKEDKTLEILNERLLQRDVEISAKYLNFRNQLIQVNEETDATLGAQREANEANIVGVKALIRLNEMIELLQKAHDQEAWGKDFGVLTAWSKVEKYVNEAHEVSIQLKLHLLELKDEMDDVFIDSPFKVYSPIQEFMHFHDIYYDRLVSDWIIQEKIVSVLNYLKGLKDNLRLVLNTLKSLLDTHDKKLAMLRQEKADILKNNLE